MKAVRMPTGKHVMIATRPLRKCEQEDDADQAHDEELLQQRVLQARDGAVDQHRLRS